MLADAAPCKGSAGVPGSARALRIQYRSTLRRRSGPVRPYRQRPPGRSARNRALGLAQISILRVPALPTLPVCAGDLIEAYYDVVHWRAKVLAVFRSPRTGLIEVPTCTGEPVARPASRLHGRESAALLRSPRREPKSPRPSRRPPASLRQLIGSASRPAAPPRTRAHRGPTINAGPGPTERHEQSACPTGDCGPACYLFAGPVPERGASRQAGGFTGFGF